MRYAQLKATMPCIWQPWGHMKIVCTLATYDNIRNSYNRDGISPLMFAVYNDYLNIAVHLLENEASFDDLLVNVDQKN